MFKKIACEQNLFLANIIYFLRTKCCEQNVANKSCAHKNRANIRTTAYKREGTQTTAEHLDYLLVDMENDLPNRPAL